MMRYILGFIAILLNTNTFANAPTFTWQAMRATNAGIVTNIHFTKSSLAYAATAGGGVFISADAGMHWKATDNKGLKDLYVQQVLGLDDKTVFAVAATGTYRSDDNGQHWRFIHLAGSRYSAAAAYKNKYADDGSTFDVHILSTIDGNNLYIANDGGQLYSSHDGGQTWQDMQVTIGNEKMLISGVTTIDNKLLYARTWTSGLIKSEDGGKTWKYINNDYVDDSGYAYVSAYQVIDSKTLLVVGNHGILKSIDGGLHWQAINNGLPAPESFRYVALYAVNTMNFVVSSNGRLYQTINGGLQWTQMPDQFSHECVLSIASQPQPGSPLLVATNGMGIFSTTDAGKTWSQATGLSAAYVTALFPLNEQTVYAGLQGGGLIVTKNGGNSWTFLNTGLSNLNVNAIATLDGKSLYVGTDKGVFFSTDEGEHFTLLSTDMANQKIDALLLMNPSLIYAGTKKGLYFSTNAGHQWKHFSRYLGLGPVKTISRLNNVITVTSAPTIINYTEDLGNTWHGVNSVGLEADTETKYPVLFRVSDQLQYVTLGSKVFIQNKLQSPSWFDISNHTSIRLNLTGVIAKNDYLFTSAQDMSAVGIYDKYVFVMGIYMTKDGGKHWEPMNDGLASLGINHLQLSGDTLFAGTEGADIYKLTVH